MTKTNVMRLLDAAGIDYEAGEYEVDEDDLSGSHAADMMGMDHDENRAWFLNEYPFEPVDISGRLGIDFQEDSLKEGYIQLYPGVHPCDGFFISVMKRKG